MIVRPQSQQEQKNQYIKTNAYTIKPSRSFIFTLTTFLSQLILHSIFIPKVIVNMNHPILNILWVFTYFMVAIIIYDYFYITCKDPADKILSNHDYANDLQPIDMFYCSICQVDVHGDSYHCRKCNRCTEGFDHHCDFLNSCIGSRNYKQFMRFVSIYILLSICYITQAVWVISAYDSWSRWSLIALILISSLKLIGLSLLLSIHVYFYCNQTTTVDYLKGRNTLKQKRKEINEKQNTDEIIQIQSQQKVINNDTN